MPSRCLSCLAFLTRRSPSHAAEEVKPSSKREKDSLLSMYGLDEISDDDDGLSEKPENMTPEQIQALIARQIALTQETDDDDPAPPLPAPFTTPPPKAAATSWGSRMAKTEPSADLPPIPPPQKSTPG